tara:strand:+ start:284 stop:2026 length:1743 start_codon:yes stop_codon:yes gene_type:complete
MAQLGEEIPQTMGNERVVSNSNLGPEIPQVIDTAIEGAETIPGYLEQVTNSYAKRQEQVNKTLKDYRAGDLDTNTGINWLDSLAGDAQLRIQTIGKGIAGPVLDTVGVAVGAGIDGISWVIPDFVEDPIKEQVGKSWDWTMNTEGGQAAKEAFSAGGAVYSKWKEENPQFAKTFESIVNVGLVLAPVKGVKPGSKPVRIMAGPVEGPMLPSANNALQNISSSLIKTGATQAKNERFESIRLLLAPDITKKNVTQRTPDGESALIPSSTFKNASLKPNASEIPVIEHLASFKNIDPKKGSSDVLVKVQASQAKLDDEISKILNRKDIANKEINLTSLDSRINYALNQVMDTPAMQSVKQVKTMMQGYKKVVKDMIKKNGNTPAGIHKSRIEFDNYMKNEKGGLAFDSANPGIRTEFVRAVRDQLNRSVDEVVPLNSVSSRRATQSLNYRAIDMLAPKAAKEIDSALTQGSQNVLRATRSTRTIVGAASTLAIGYGGYSAIGKDMLTVLALGGAVTIAGIGSKHLLKNAMSAKTKNSLGRLISQIDRGIKETKNPDMRLSLRRNKVIISSLLSLPSEKEQEQ